MLSFFRRLSKSKLGTGIVALLFTLVLIGFAATGVTNFGSGDIGLGFVALIVLAGAVGLFGIRTRTVTASSAGYTMALQYPATDRADQPVHWLLTLKHAGGFSGPVDVAITQSYLFSVGNIGTATAWICLFLVARQPEPATSSERIASKSPAMLA